MNNALAAPPDKSTEPTAPWAGLDQIAGDYVARWLGHCRAFLDWHREQLIGRHPTPEVLNVNERIHPWMIRATRLMHCQMLDPAFAHPDLAREVEAVLWQL